MKTPRELITGRHRHVEAKLNSIQAQELAALSGASHARQSPERGYFFSRVLQEFWLEAIVPWRRVWLGLAAAWFVILALNFTARDTTAFTIAKISPPSPEIQLALAEQRRLLAETLNAPLTVSRPKVPGPRSDLRLELFIG